MAILERRAGPPLYSQVEERLLERIRRDFRPGEPSRALGLKARERTVVVERLRTLDGEPLCTMRNELPLDLVPELPEEGLTQESLYGWLKERHGLVPRRADEEIEARLPSKE